MRRKHGGWRVGGCLAVLACLAGCPIHPAPPDDGDAEGSAVAASSEGTADGMSETDAADDVVPSDGLDESDSDEGYSFARNPDAGVTLACSVFAQDCPDGEKCTPFANDGGNRWNATICSLVEPNPGEPGDRCTVQGSGTSGMDSCRRGAMCWDVDPETDEGTCVAMCEGSPQTPSCADSRTQCIIGNDGALALCLEACDPLLQDCVGDQACYPVAGGFTCAPDNSGTTGGTGDPCGAINGCDPGLMCAVADVVADCAADACCTPLCDITQADADAACDAVAAGQDCVPMYDDGTAPPGYDAVGACMLPQ